MKGFLGWSWLSNDYKDIWNKVGNIIKKELDCKPIYTNFIFEKKRKTVLQWWGYRFSR